MEHFSLLQNEIIQIRWSLVNLAGWILIVTPGIFNLSLIVDKQMTVLDDRLLDSFRSLV